MAASSPSRRKRTDWLHIGSGKSYAHRVHWPLQCLVFITPLLLIYQIGAAVQAGGGAGNQGANTPPQLMAFSLMLSFFGFFGAAGNVLPLAAVIAILLFWHLARKDPWDFDPKLYGGMAAESILWGIPFIVLGLAMARHVYGPGMATAGGTAPAMPLNAQWILSVGAGVYEELLFRLIAITCLSTILVDMFNLPVSYAIPIIIISSALLFSAYHLLGNESFDAGRFAFRTALGVYLAGIYLYRGYGITVGAHTVYDLIAVSLPHFM